MPKFYEEASKVPDQKLPDLNLPAPPVYETTNEEIEDSKLTGIDKTLRIAELQAQIEAIDKEDRYAFMLEETWKESKATRIKALMERIDKLQTKK